MKEEKWLRQLLAPGSSLGGARPKASVMVVHDLAGMCGLNVPEAKVEKFSKLGRTFLVKRFA